MAHDNQDQTNGCVSFHYGRRVLLAVGIYTPQAPGKAISRPSRLIILSSLGGLQSKLLVLRPLKLVHKLTSIERALWTFQ
jgi:hypothetical protein